MTDIEYAEMLAKEKSNLMGKTFALSVRKGLESKSFVENIMCNPKLNGLVNQDNDQRWCDDVVLLDHFSRMYTFKSGETVDEYMMWFLGYLYKYWMHKKNLNSVEVYKILPFERYLVMYNFYHTQDWNYIIEDATKVYKDKSYII